MRLIDADNFIKWLDIGHLRHPSELCFSELNVETMIKLQPTIDPETLPVVQKLRETAGARGRLLEKKKRQLADLTAERDARNKNYKLIVRGRNLSEQHPADEFVCSECGFTTQEFDSYDPEEDAHYEFIIKFCPNCGADMRGDQR